MSIRLHQVEFPEGKAVFLKGSPGDEFYIIKEGTAVVKDSSGHVLSKMGPGSCFGERALMGAEVREAAAVGLLCDYKNSHGDTCNSLSVAPCVKGILEMYSILCRQKHLEFFSHPLNTRLPSAICS